MSVGGLSQVVGCRVHRDGVDFAHSDRHHVVLLVH